MSCKDRVTCCYHEIKGQVVLIYLWTGKRLLEEVAKEVRESFNDKRGGCLNPRDLCPNIDDLEARGKAIEESIIPSQAFFE